MSGNGSDAPAETVHGAVVSWSHGQKVVHVRPSEYLDLVSALKADGFTYCSDLCAVDYLNHAGRALPGEVPIERFEVVVSLLSMRSRERIRVRAHVPDGDPSIDSLFHLFPGTEAMEREAYDMFGITFRGHPDMTRILMPEDWEGYPLRKDYSPGRIPVQFKAAPGSR